jgi:predicted enzyme related to lactoylglutathione lyase
MDPPASIMLQLVPERKTALKNRAHPDFLVEDVAAATAQVVGLGGSVVKEPGLFFEPGSPDPVLEWAVVADPSGNEFCVIRELPEPNVPT